jgi:nicotinamide riboside kinase
MARIGLTGSVSVGKTTLVNEISKLEIFKDYKIATERSKYLRDLGIPLNTDSTLKGQTIFLAERCSELLYNNLLTDRTIYDVCAFTLSAQSINWGEKEDFIKYAMRLRNEYDIIFYVSPEGVEIEDNGVRTTDSVYRDKIDLVINELLQEYPPKRLIKIKGTTEERIEAILKSI